MVSSLAGAPGDSLGCRSGCTAPTVQFERDPVEKRNPRTTRGSLVSEKRSARGLHGAPGWWRSSRSCERYDHSVQIGAATSFSPREYVAGPVWSTAPATNVSPR